MSSSFPGNDTSSTVYSTVAPGGILPEQKRARGRRQKTRNDVVKVDTATVYKGEASRRVQFDLCSHDLEGIRGLSVRNDESVEGAHSQRSWGHVIPTPLRHVHERSSPGATSLSALWCPGDTQYFMCSVLHTRELRLSKMTEDLQLPRQLVSRRSLGNGRIWRRL